MSSITYTKGLRTPNSELNAIGFTQFEMFLTEYSVTHRSGVIETIKQLIAKEDFAKKHKSAWNTHLQQTYGINKRHAGGIIADAIGQYKSAIECRKNHVAQLKGKIKSVEKWLKSKRKQLKDGAKFYRRKNWQGSKSGLKLPLSSNLKSHRTNWQQLRFAIHHKARKLAHLQRQVAVLGDAPIHVSVPKQQVFIVGSKDEPCGNRNVQWNRDTGVLKFRVPYFLEAKYGKFIETQQGDYERRIDRMPVDGAKTWHFYYKAGKWNAAVQFTPTKVDRISKHSNEGALGINLNPGAIGWTLVDRDGNLAASGQIPLQMNLPSGQQQAQIADACLQLIALATTFQVPIVIEKLDFAKKKSQLKEKGRKYARMLSG